jgi:intergrase/recombinase
VKHKDKLPTFFQFKPQEHIITPYNIDWKNFKNYLYNKYSKNWAYLCFRYALKYHELINNLSELETFNNDKRNNVLKALIALAKYHGFYREFKERIKDFGIKWTHSSSIDSFLRIFSNNNKNILVWYHKAIDILNDECSTYLKFQLMSGLRPREGINSFNLMRTRLDEYYNEEFGILEHFRFKDVFLRNTKNAFITIIPKSLITKIAKKNEVTYPMVQKKLQRNNMSVKISQLRDYYATFMVRHGLIKEEVDLLQGRISESIFVRHYWSPAIKELKQRVIKALTELEKEILS